MRREGHGRKELGDLVILVVTLTRRDFVTFLSFMTQTCIKQHGITSGDSYA